MKTNLLKFNLLILALLVISSGLMAQNHIWEPGGDMNGTGLWEEPANWRNGLPGSVDAGRAIFRGGTISVSSDVSGDFRVELGDNKNDNRAVLTIEAGGIVGANRTAQGHSEVGIWAPATLIVEEGASMSTGTHLWIGTTKSYHEGNAEMASEVHINGGTITVGEMFGIDFYNDKEFSGGTLFLNGGLLDLAQWNPGNPDDENANASLGKNGKIAYTDGLMRIKGNHKASLEWFRDNDQITGDFEIWVEEIDGVTFTKLSKVLITGINVTATDDATAITTDNGTLQMIASILPEEATDKTVTWSVNDEDIATIDTDGLLTAKADGVVTVTATANDGSEVTGSLEITISGQSTPDAPNAEIFISSSGDDTNNGSTALLAVKSFSRAQALVAAGGVIHVSGMIDFSTDMENASEAGISLDKDLIVQGTSNETDGFDGKGLTRFIQSEGFSLTLKDLKLTGGATSENGGALRLVGSTVIIENVIFDSNTADRGGAIFAESGNITLDGCTIQNNVDVTQGGAISVVPSGALTLDVKNTLIKDNESSGHGAAIFYVDNEAVASTIKFTNCAIVSNTSTGNSVGAVYVNNNIDGATIDLSFINTTISNNVAGDANGGAMRVDNAYAGSSISLINCTVTENQVTGTSAAGGAGIRILRNVTNNGGVVNIYNSILENNYCPGVDYSNANYTGDFAWQGEGFTPGTTLIIENSLLGRPGSPNNAGWQAPEFSTSKMNYVAVVDGDVRNSYLAKLGEFDTTLNYYPLLGGSEAINHGLATHLQSLNPAVNTDQVGNIRPFTDGKCHAGSVEIVISIEVTGITITAADDATTITTNGGTLQMVATVLPEDATDKTVTWSVNDEDIATIDPDGLLTAKADGVVTVTATANDGSKVTGSLEITISEQTTPVVEVTGITVEGDAGATTITTNGGTLQMTANVAPENATDKSVTWSVNDEAIATIDADGLLTAKADGVVTVTATAKDGSGVTGYLEITISDQGTSNNELSLQTLSVYPNPVRDILHLRNLEGVSRVSVISITGQIVKEVEVYSHETEISLFSLPSGVYTIRFQGIDADFVNLRVIKQ